MAKKSESKQIGLALLVLQVIVFLPVLSEYIVASVDHHRWLNFLFVYAAVYLNIEVIIVGISGKLTKGLFWINHGMLCGAWVCLFLGAYLLGDWRMEIVALIPVLAGSIPQIYKRLRSDARK